MPSKIELKNKLYQARYSEEWKPWKSDLPRIEAIVNLAGGNKRVLDIGCYDATISQLIAQNHNEVYGIDISAEAVKIANQKRIKAYCLDIENEELPFDNIFFDVIVASEVIEHIFDLDSFFNRINRVLKPDGYLILTTPNLATLGRRLLLLFGKNPFIETIFKEGWGGHIRYFVKDSLFELLNVYGYRVDYFTSDVVNFNGSGNLFSSRLAKIWPTIGKTLIVKVSKNRK